jgi:hypothetical protein
MTEGYKWYGFAREALSSRYGTMVVVDNVQLIIVDILVLFLFMVKRQADVKVIPVQDSRRQATEGQSQSVRLPETRLKIAPYQRSILVGYVDKIRRVG